MINNFTLSIRLVVGWTYFSAFWRRLILDDKLIPGEAGYIGEKFNHFLPNALGIKPIIEHLVSHPEDLQVAMVTFTIVEAIVGLLLIFGLFTRLMSIGVLSLALGILLGSGWLGTTCLDEWQIGVLGIAGGFTLFLTGGDAYSVDGWIMSRKPAFTQSRWFRWLGSGMLPLENPRRLLFAGSLLIFSLTLFTNQVFHGGVWGTVHNKSVKPKLEISKARVEQGKLNFRLYRTEGADVYGSFLIAMDLLTQSGDAVMSLDARQLSSLPKKDIHNHYVAQIKPGKHSLVIPLGAKADISLDLSPYDLPSGQKYMLKLTDISGIEWDAAVEVEERSGI